MFRNKKKVIIIFCIIIIISLILYITTVVINFFTKDRTTKEITVGINPVVATKSIMTYQEPITVILENKEKKEILQKKQVSEENLQDREELEEKQVIEEKLQECFKIETNITPEEQMNEEKKEINVETVTEEAKQLEETKQPEEIQNAVITENEIFPTVGKIEIPQTGVNIPILNQVTVEGMKNAPCLLYATGKLNENGNNLIVGHNFRNGTIFSDNKNLQLGDKIFVTTLDGNRVEYTIYNKFVTTAEDVSYIKRDTQNKPEITLSCCTDDDEYRIIILAKI